jgi:hypothetical protein
MRFFTPELYLRFNSSDDEIADRANEEWEAALEEYQRHLNSIRDRMPSQVRKVTEFSLHDAEVLGLEKDHQPLDAFAEAHWPGPLWSALAILSLKQDRTVRSLIYTLWDGVREHPARDDWPFSRARKHWLYDEVDVAADHRGAYLHRILFSDGSVVEIPFASVIAFHVNLPGAEENAVPRRTA